MKFQQISRDAGPSSSIGIMRFFDTDSGGPKIKPEVVIAISLGFTLIVAAIHFIS